MPGHGESRRSCAFSSGEVTDRPWFILGVAEEGRVEVDAVALLLAHSTHGSKCLYSIWSRSTQGFVGEDGVGRVQVDALLARDERHRLLEVGCELLEVARAAQVVARVMMPPDAALSSPWSKPTTSRPASS